MMFGTISAAALELGDFLFGLVTFICLMLLVGKFAWKPVTKMMNDRQSKITGDLDYADKSKNEAKELLEKRQGELKNTQAEAVSILNNKEKQLCKNTFSFSE